MCGLPLKAQTDICHHFQLPVFLHISGQKLSYLIVATLTNKNSIDNSFSMAMWVLDAKSKDGRVHPKAFLF